MNLGQSTISLDIIIKWFYSMMIWCCNIVKAVNSVWIIIWRCSKLGAAYLMSRGTVRSVASSYAAVCMVAGLRPVLVIAWEWHIGLALLCGCSGALEYPTTNSCGPINKSPSSSYDLCNLFFHVLSGLCCLCCFSCVGVCSLGCRNIEL